MTDFTPAPSGGAARNADPGHSRHHALVRLLARLLHARVERNGEACAAVDVHERFEGRVVGDLAAVLCRGAHRQVGVAFDDDHGDRAIAVQLQDQGAVEFDVGREQRGRGHHFTEQMTYRRRVVVTLEHGAPRRVEADVFAAHRGGVEHEFLKLIGHG